MINSPVLIVKSRDYSYSEPIVIKKWSSGQIVAKVGYVIKHPERNCIVLEKIWKVDGGVTKNQTYNIKKGDWSDIKAAIEKLLPEIGEAPTADDIDQAIIKVSNETELLELISRYPTILSQVPENVDILSLPNEHKEALRKLLSVGGEIANSVITKLSDQPIKDLEQFVQLLAELKLSTINSLVTHITSRLGFIDMFEKAIHDDGSYEIKGSNSIHNLLKANIWILDRNYSVLQDNSTLKKIIETYIEKNAVAGENLDDRPDFLCMIDPLSEARGYKRLVIIEIKRPSVKITFDHVSQVMRYRSVLEKYSGSKFDDFTCYLISREIDPELSDLSESGFIVKTYTDFISDTRKFYQEYRRIIEKEEYAF